MVSARALLQSRLPARRQMEPRPACSVCLEQNGPARLLLLLLLLLDRSSTGLHSQAMHTGSLPSHFAVQMLQGKLWCSPTYQTASSQLAGSWLTRMGQARERRDSTVTWRPAGLPLGPALGLTWATCTAAILAYLCGF